jgi:hypothetical protein
VAIFELTSSEPPSSPVLVIGLEGWVDAGFGAAAAVRALVGASRPRRLASFDPDLLLDYRARRPTVTISEGTSTRLAWQEIQLLAGRDLEGRDVCLLVGPEPDLRWREFSRAVAELAGELSVRLAVGLGAFPAPAPHTRPVRLAATSTDAELAARVGVVSGTLEVPAGIEAVLEHALAQAGVPAVGLWARVPHYVAAMPYPAASAALVDGLCQLAGLAFDSSGLHAAADEARRRVDSLIAQSAEHTQMVRQLEASIDAAEGNPLDLGEIPSGDQIAAELERYLRGEG